MVSFIEKIFGKQEPNYDSEAWNKMNRWVEKNNDSGKYDYDYEGYLRAFYFNKIAKGFKEEPMKYKHYLKEKQKFIEDETARFMEDRRKKLANSRIKLTNAEHYLIDAAEIDKGGYKRIAGEWHDGGEFNKTAGELRDGIRRMRKRRDYQMLKDLDLALQNTKGLQELYDLFYGENAKFSQNLIWKASSDLGRFVIAENKIAGLTEDEIKRLAILEAL